MALSPGAVTLATIRNEAVSRADLPTPSATTELSLADWNAYINKSFLGYYKQVTTLYEDYYLIPQPYPTITTNGTDSQYPLPPDVFKISGVNQLLTAAPTGRIALKRFNMIDRARWQYPGIARGAYPIMRYCQFGTPSKLWLVPEPPNGGVIMEILYSPKPPQFADSGTLTLNGVVAGNQVNITVGLTIGPNVVATNTIAIGANTYTAVSGAPSGNQFTVGASDALTAASLVAQINANTSAAANITATQPNTTLPSILLTFNLLAVTGATSGTRFQVGASDTLTAVNLAATISALGSLTLSATSSSAVVTASFNTVASVSGQVVRWTATNTLALFPSPTWANAFDFINGDEEVVILDAAIKAMTKMQLDISALAMERARLEEVIRTTDSNRDEGQSFTVSDTRSIGDGTDDRGDLPEGY